MGLISDVFETRAVGDGFSNELLDALGISGPSTGQSINEFNATQQTAVWAAIRVISENIASLPLILYQRKDGGKQRAENNPLFNTLHKNPNPWMTKFEFIETVVGHALTWGNSYVNIERMRNGKKNLWPIRPDQVEVRIGKGGFFPEGQLGYLVDMRGRSEMRKINPSNMMHVRGYSSNGIVGESPIRKMNDAVGLAKATEEFGAGHFGGDGMPRGALVHPDVLGEEGRDTLRNEWQKAYRGMDSAHRVAVLEEGVEWQDIGLPPQDSQFLQTREFQTVEIARMFNIQPHKLQHLEDEKAGDIEERNLEFVQSTLRPWLVRIEEAIVKSLVPESRNDLFAEFLVEGLLRGDSEARADFYQKAVTTGWMSRNEVRDRENMDPKEGLDRMMFPTNEAIVAKDGETQPVEGNDNQVQGDNPEENRSLQETIEKRQAADRSRVASSFEPVFQDAAARIIRREVADLRPIAEKNLPQEDVNRFQQEMNNFLFDDHVNFVKKNIKPAIRSLSQRVSQLLDEELKFDMNEFDTERVIEKIAQQRAERHVGKSAGQLSGIIRNIDEFEGTMAEEVDRRLNEWNEKRPEKIAQNEPHQAQNNFSMAAFAAAPEVTKIEWSTIGTNCPACNEMAGSVVGVETEFVQEGESVGKNEITPSQSVTHPRLHDGCDCFVTPK